MISQAKNNIGVPSSNILNGTIRGDEWQSELKGRRGIKNFREMRDSDSTVGAVMYAIEQVLRDIKFKVKPANESEEAKQRATFVEEVLSDMDHTLDDHISECISFLSYGFDIHEVVYKRRNGPSNNPKTDSKYSDGYMGIKKLAPRAQWTINRFEVDKDTGDILGVYQDNAKNSGFIPKNKILHYKTTTTNSDPSGRSILRNAFKSYTYLTKIQALEAIAIEREWHGLPVGRLPLEYLAEDASDAQKATLEQMKRALKNVRLDQEGYIILPSDTWVDDAGKPTSTYQVDVKLISSEGNRSIDTGTVIKRYQQEIARTVMSEFVFLGTSGGSYALSKSKADLFFRSLESYINMIFDVLNKQLIPQLWKINGFSIETMPYLVAGDIAPHDLKELGSYLRNLNGAGFPLTEQIELLNELLDIAELPKVDEKSYKKELDSKKTEDKGDFNKKEEDNE